MASNLESSLRVPNLRPPTGTQNLERARAVPLIAVTLGCAGLLPFVGLVVAQRWGAEPFGRSPLDVLSVYGAVILSFTGAVHWGLAMAQSDRDGTWGYLVSIMPAALGWFAICFLPQPVALQVMAAAFVGLLLYDLRSVRVGVSPAWYGRLRWPLTLFVVASLLLASAMS